MGKILRRIYTDKGVDYTVVDEETGKTLAHGLRNIRNTLDLQAESAGKKTPLYATPLNELKQSHRSKEQLNTWLEDPTEVPTDAAAYLGMQTLQHRFSGWQLNPTYLSDYKNYVGLADIVATRGNETKLIKINSYRRNEERNAIELGMLKYMYGKMYPSQNITGTYSLNITQGKDVGKLIPEKPAGAHVLNETFGLQIGPQRWKLPKIPVVNLDKQAIEQAKNAPQLPNVFAKAGNTSNLIGIHTTLDIETGAGNKPIQIAAYKLGYNPVTRKMEIIDTYVRYYEGAGSPSAESIHGLTPQVRHELRKATNARYSSKYNSIEQESLYNFLAGTKVVGENIIGFDLPNLFTYEQRSELAKQGGIIDTAQLGANFRPRGTNSLDALFQAAFHKSMSQMGLHHHGAIDDVLATEMIVQHIAGTNSKMGSVLRGLLFSSNAISTQWAELRHAWTTYGEDGKRIGGYIDMTTGKEYSEDDFLSDKDMAKDILDITENGAAGMAALVESIRQQSEESALTRRGMLHTEQAIAQSVTSFRDAINTMAGSSKTSIASTAAKARNDAEMREILANYGVPSNEMPRFERLAKIIQATSPSYVTRSRIDLGRMLGKHGALLSDDEYEYVSQTIESGDYGQLLDAKDLIRGYAKDEQDLLREEKAERKAQRLAEERFEYRRETEINKALASGDQYTADRLMDATYNANYDALAVMKAQIAKEKKDAGAVTKDPISQLRFARRLNTEVLKAEATGNTDLADRLRGLTYQADYDIIAVEKAKAAKEASENMKKLNEEMQKTSTVSRGLSGALAQLGHIPYYNYSRWGTVLGNEIGGVTSAARGIIPTPFYQPTSRAIAAYQNMLAKETGNFKSKQGMLQALGQGFTGLGGVIGLLATGGNPLGAAAGAAISGTISGGVNAATQAHGTNTEINIRTAGETLQAKFNMLGALIEYAKAPFSLLYTAIRGVSGAFNRLRSISLNVISKNIANMINLGTPWTYLTQANSYGYRRSRYVDMASGLKGGSVNASWNNWAGAQQDLYTTGQLDTNRVVAAAMLGEFSSVYSMGGDTEEQYGGFIDRQLNALQGADKYSQARTLRLIEKVDPNAAQIISRISQMRNVAGYENLTYKDLTNPGRFGVYARPLTDEERGRSFITATQWQMQKSTFQDTGIRLVNTIWSSFGNKFATQINETLDTVVTKIGKGDWKGALESVVGEVEKIWNSIKRFAKEKGIGSSFRNTIVNMFTNIGSSIITIWHDIVNSILDAAKPLIAFFKDLHVGFDAGTLAAEIAKGKKGNILKAFTIGFESTTDKSVASIDDLKKSKSPVSRDVVMSFATGALPVGDIVTQRELIGLRDEAVNWALEKNNGVLPLYIGGKQIGRLTGSSKAILEEKLNRWLLFNANMGSAEEMWQHLGGDTPEAAELRKSIYDSVDIGKNLNTPEGYAAFRKAQLNALAGKEVEQAQQANDNIADAAQRGLKAMAETFISIDIKSDGKDIASVQADSNGEVKAVTRTNIANISIKKGMDKQVAGGN